MTKKFSNQEAPKKEIPKPNEQKEPEQKKPSAIADRLKMFANNGFYLRWGYQQYSRILLYAYSIILLRRRTPSGSSWLHEQSLLRRLS